MMRLWPDSISKVEKVFIWFIFITHVYFIYRYPFKYGSASTSGTYSSTPFIFKVGKYLIVLLMEFYVLVQYTLSTCKVSLSRGQKIIIFFVVLFASYLSFSSVLNIGSGVGNISFAVETTFFIPLVLFFALFLNKKEYFYTEIIFYSFAYHLFYSLVQVILYVMVGRLPNIGYPGGFARFGGGWDTPNAFGMFIILPFVLGLALHRHQRRALLKVIILTTPILILLTISLTATAVFIGAFGLFLLLSRRWSQLFVGVFFLVGGVAAAIATPGIYELIVAVMEAKSESIAAHQESLDLGKYLGGHNIFELLGGGVGDQVFSESTYVYVLSNFGVFGFLVLSLIIGLSVINGIFKINTARRYSPRRADLFAAYVTYVIAFAIGAINLPFFSIFPVNVYFWFSVVMIWFMPATSDVERQVSTVPA